MSHALSAARRTVDYVKALERENRRLRKALAQAKEHKMSEQSGWQPIETAPKDGRLIIGWSSGWVSPTSMKMVDGDWDWMGTLDCPPIAEPTHWMPLPAPPKETP